MSVSRTPGISSIPGQARSHLPAGASLLDTAPGQPMSTVQDPRPFLRAVLDGLGAHICVLDADGTIVTVNQAWRDFARANGAAADAVDEGTNYLEVVRHAQPAATVAPQGPDVMAFHDLLQQVLAGRRAGFELEYACHSPCQQRWFMVRVSRLGGPGPGAGYTLVAHDDVTPLKQAQQTLRASEALLLDLTASIPGAVFRLELFATPGLRSTWRFVYLSAGVQALYGISPEQGCADPQALRSRVLPEDLPLHDASLAAAVAAARSWAHEFRIRDGSGQVKWVHALAQVQRAAEGLMCCTGVLSDVSQRKRIEAELVASEQTYRTLFETVPQGIVYHDRQGRITSANPAAERILGLSLAQMQGRTPVDARWRAVHEDGSAFPGEEHPAAVALRTGQPVHDVVMGLRLPGAAPVWILVNATPLFGPGSALQSVYTSFEDITQRVIMSQELLRQASTDDLTGAANRRTLMARLVTELDRVRRHPVPGCALIALDLDHFKRVNDAWGHAATRR